MVYGAALRYSVFSFSDWVLRRSPKNKPGLGIWRYWVWVVHMLEGLGLGVLGVTGFKFRCCYGHLAKSCLTMMEDSRNGPADMVAC